MYESATDADLVGLLRERVTGEVRAGEPLAGHTTLRVGGPAAALVRVDGTGDLAAVAEVCAALGRPWLRLGRGSNLLVADSGWSGVVVALGRGFRGVERDGDGLLAGGAEPMPALASRAGREGLAGLAFGVAIPGTLGGAVRMNAGAHGGQIADVLDWVEVARLGCGGVVERRAAASLGLTYRHSVLPDDAVVVRARLALQPAGADQLAADMAEMRRWRRDHQPLSDPSCGSVFRNPPGHSAGRLIESVGLRGHQIGGARISDKHANFIVAANGACAFDVATLIGTARQAVADAHGIALQREVVMVGFGDDGDPGP